MAIMLVRWADVKAELEKKRTAIVDYGEIEIDQEVWSAGVKYVVWGRGPAMIDPKTGQIPVARWNEIIRLDDLLELKCWLMDKGYLLPE